MRPRDEAIEHRYLALNSKQYSRWLPFDIDHPESAFAWDDGNVAPPNIMMENIQNGHAHFAYCLQFPVSTSEKSKSAPQNYMRGVRDGYRRRLNADINYTGRIAKNPLNKHWRTTWLSKKPYLLHDLGVWLEPSEMRPIRERKNETEFLGRNCAIQCRLSRAGIREARKYKNQNQNFKAFEEAMRSAADELNAEYAPNFLPYSELRHIVKSVAKWSWANSTQERFSEIQSFRAQSRRRRNLEVMAGIEILDQISNTELAVMLGRSVRTARRYRSIPRSEYETNSLSRRKPWEAEGVSRRTWYRRRTAGETSRTKPSE